MPLERYIAVNALPPTIGAIADESAIPSWPIAALTARPAKPSATSAAESSAPSTAKSARALPTWAAAGASRGAWNTRGLPFHSRARKSTRRLQAQHGPAQPEIILAGLQTVAQRSIDQKCFVRVPRRGWSGILRSGGGNLVQFVYRRCSRCGAEAALLLGTLRRLPGVSLARLQIKRPGLGRRARSNVNLLASRLKSEHLNFQRVSSGREIRQFICAGLIGGCHRAAIALSRDYRGSRQRLASELHNTRGCDRGLRVQRRSKNKRQTKPEH